MAALGPKPRDRVHFAVKFAAGAMRVAAILILLAAVGLGVALFNVTKLPGLEGVEVAPLLAVVITIVSVVFALITALVLWGFADGLVLLADVDDAQRATQRQLADVILAQRTDRGPFHAESVPTKRESA